VNIISTAFIGMYFEWEKLFDVQFLSPEIFAKNLPRLRPMLIWSRGDNDLGNLINGK
jgi:hypothetical protein